jgi:protein tyrosine/serine phosphatase
MSMDISKTGGRVLAWLDMHLVDHGAIRALYNNFYDLGGGMYRSSQPSPAQLARYQKKYGLRTVINLRGPHGYGSYALEKEACDKLGLALHDVKLYSRTPPEVEEVHAMDELFKTLEYPALLHCKSGADRASLAATLYRVLHLGHPVAEAITELGWTYGHFRHSATGVIDFIFARYLADHARQPVAFMTWIDNAYDADAIRTEFRPGSWSALLVDKVLRRE